MAPSEPKSSLVGAGKGLVLDISNLRWRRALARVRNLGISYTCPFCESALSRWLPFGLNLPVFERAGVIGGGYRENGLCPVCFSSDRERLLYLYLREHTNVFERPVRLLHVAPEGHLSAALRRTPTLTYCSGDLSSAAVTVHLDLVCLPFSTGTFDAIICSHVLEHVPNDRAAMLELLRVLAPGGWAIIQVPIASRLDSTHEDLDVVSVEDRERLFGKNDHVRLYAWDFVDRLRGVGFEVRVRRPGRERASAWALRYGLSIDEPVFFCERPENGPRASCLQ